MKTRFVKVKSFILLTALGALGFTGCEKDDGDEIVPCYGVPVSKYNNEQVLELEADMHCEENLEEKAN